jgi:hypothetical protein
LRITVHNIAVNRTNCQGGQNAGGKTRGSGRNPPGKLADAELQFTDSVLAGLKLIGFAIWERRGGAGRNVTFPARQYSVNGERRSFALLRPITDATAQDGIRD